VGARGGEDRTGRPTRVAILFVNPFCQILSCNPFCQSFLSGERAFVNPFCVSSASIASFGRFGDHFPRFSRRVQNARDTKDRGKKESSILSILCRAHCRRYTFIAIRKRVSEHSSIIENSTFPKNLLWFSAGFLLVLCSLGSRFLLCFL